MRTATHDVDLVFNEEEFIGVCLGWDFTAEHEAGIKSLKRDLGCDDRKYGFDSTLIHNNKSIWINQHSEGAIVSSKSTSFSDVKSWHSFEHKDKNGVVDVVLHAAWSECDFAISFSSMSDDIKLKVNSLIKAFTNKDICISFTSSSNPFSNSGLTFLIYSKIPKEIKERCKKEDIDHIKLTEDFDNNKIICKLRSLANEWRNDHQCHSSPWDYYALSVRGRKGKDDFNIWLNPSNQKYLDSNWITLKDVEKWIDGKPGKIIKSKDLWDELKYICSGPAIYAIAGDIKYFSHAEPKFYNVSVYGNPSKMPVIPPLDKNGKMTKKAIKIIASIILDKYASSIENLLQYGDHNSKRVESVMHITGPRKDTENEVHGFFNALALLGYGEFGACNTPAEPSNFSWWQDVLFSEALWHAICKQGLGYQPWIDNGKTLGGW